jgi:hypothetical protein
MSGTNRPLRNVSFDGGDPGGVGVYVNPRESPGGASRGLRKLPLSYHPGGVDLYLKMQIHLLRGFFFSQKRH